MGFGERNGRNAHFYLVVFMFFRTFINIYYFDNLKMTRFVCPGSHLVHHTDGFGQLSREKHPSAGESWEVADPGQA